MILKNPTYFLEHALQKCKPEEFLKNASRRDFSKKMQAGGISQKCKPEGFLKKMQAGGISQKKCKPEGFLKKNPKLQKFLLPSLASRCSCIFLFAFLLCSKVQPFRFFSTLLMQSTTERARPCGSHTQNNAPGWN